MSNDNKIENRALQSLINVNEDAAEFYETAQEKVEDKTMISTFKSLEGLHESVITNLQGILKANGEDDVEADETITGSAREMFATLMAKVSNDPDALLVTHLEEAEDRCLHYIKDAMENEDISPATKAALQGELTALQKSHDYVKSLKDQMKVAA